MKVSLKWLKELVEYPQTTEELTGLLNHKTIGTKEVTDSFIELDMKGYNRADLLSMRGVAYETAAITDSRVTFTEEPDTGYYWVEKTLPNLDVKVEDSTDCPLYCLVKIENLKVGPSDQEWVQKLTDSGLRTVNNIADITNLIMLEYGQPLHAFDAGQIRDEKIIVRRAGENEELVTLDNKKRILTKDDLVIADPTQAVGIAGVMGGKNSEITDQTTSVLLEAAIFSPTMLRKTANRLALSSEASKRFYHGLTEKRLMQSLNAAIKMYRAQGGEVTALTISGQTGEYSAKIPVRLSKINSLIGENIPSEQAETYFKRLNFTVTDKVISGDQTSYVITPPYFRLDLEVEEDIVEEVARLYGYENINSSQIENIQQEENDQSGFVKIRRMKNSLKETGLTEVFTYPYYSTEILKVLGIEGEYFKILNKIQNPISNETEYLRQNLWPNLLEAAARNFKNGFKEIAIFEIGKVYSISETKQPVEKYQLSILLLNGTSEPIRELLSIFKKFISTENNCLKLSESTVQGVAKTLFHPKRFLSVAFDNTQIGGISEIHPRLTDQLGLPKRAAVVEIDLTPLIEIKK